MKTLEEPPPHVKFIFATTEPQAVPETIVSRCQRFEFRRIPADAIVGRLALIAEREGVEVEDGVLQQIALKAEGGLRDSTSLLDQVVAFAGERVTQADLDRVVGVIDTEVLGAILDAAGEGDLARLMDGLDAAFETGRDAEEILLQLVEILREAMVREARGLAGGGDSRRGALVGTVRNHFPLDRLLFALRICLNARREIKLVGHGRVQLELAALKIARSGDLLPVREILERLERGGPAAPETASRPAAGGGRATRASAEPPPRPASRPPLGAAAKAPAPPAEPARSGPAEKPRAAPEAVEAAPRRGPPPSLERMRGDWGRLIDHLRQRSARVASMLDGAVPAKVVGSDLHVALEGNRSFQKEQLEGPQRRLVEEAVAEVFGHRLRLRYDLCEAGKEGSRPVTRKIHEDPAVRRIIDNFDGGIIAVDNEGSPS